MALNGPLQGHLVGVQTFINSGVIDLQSNPVAGDVLVITIGTFNERQGDQLLLRGDIRCVGPCVR
jgi:hypothetical protein